MTVVEPETREMMQVGATPLAGQRMRAMRHAGYGSFDLIRPAQVDVPCPRRGQVRVRVHHAGLHVGDCFGVHGSPFPMRFATGLFGPRLGIPGFDFSGIVDAVGEGASRFAVGDAVLGCGEGTCAEFAVVSEKTVTHKPAGVSFEDAAALPTSGLAALHAMRDAAKVGPGSRVLINGASGGVGSFALQIAVHLGAQVAAVCSAKNAELMRSLGATEVIDYRTQDYTLLGPRFDLVFDNIENRAVAHCRRLLVPHGTLLLNSGTGATGLRMLTRLIAPLLLSPFVNHKLRRYLSVPNSRDLSYLADLMESGLLRAVIDRSYPLGEVRAALEHIEAGHARGKVVVAVSS